MQHQEMKEFIDYFLSVTSVVYLIEAYFWFLYLRKYKNKQLGFSHYNLVHYPM